MNTEIIFEEAKIEREPESPMIPGQVKFSEGHGFLAYRKEDLGKSRLLDDVNVFYLEFFGDDPNDDTSEAWATPLRAIVLERLAHRDWNWYLSFFGDVPDQISSTGVISINQDFKNGFLKAHSLHYTEFSTPEYGITIEQRLFLEVPPYLLESVVTRYWPQNYPAYPIQGLQLPPNQIDLLCRWSERHRDVRLFREIIDHVRIMFYTFPSENCHFIFITNKVSFSEMQKALDLDDLRERARGL
jgi:hypothetical protein